MICWRCREGRAGIERIVLNADVPSQNSQGICAGNFACQNNGDPSPPQIEDIVRKLNLLLQGREVEFPLGILNMDKLTRFQHEVLAFTSGIPRGEVRSYREVAEAVGRPKAARAVGNALASNPFPLAVPCHRVIRTDGGIGGFGAGPEIKRKLLALEVERRGR